MSFLKYFLQLWAYSFRLNKYKTIHQIYILFLHLLPAIIIDKTAELCGKKPRYCFIHNSIKMLFINTKIKFKKKLYFADFSIQKLTNIIYYIFF